MAKTRTVTRTVVARAPSPTIRVVAPAPQRLAKTRRYARRGAQIAGGTAGMWVPVIASWLLGKAKANGTNIPTIIPGLGPAANAAIIAYGLGRWAKIRQASQAAVGFASVAAYSHGLGQGIGDDLLGAAGNGRAVVYDDED